MTYLPTSEFLDAIRRRDYDCAVRLMIQHPDLLTSPLWEDLHAVHCAALENAAPLIPTLARLAVPLNLRTGDEGYTPLILACRIGALEVTEALLQAGADCNEGDVLDGYPPLFWAIIGGNALICDALASYGACMLFADSDGWTAMHVAAAHGRRSVLPLLARHGLSAVRRDHQGMTPLDIAAQFNDQQTLAALQNLTLGEERPIS